VSARAARLAAGLALLLPAVALAEPYLAVRQGLKCGMCHVNPTGGGMRNAFGNAYALNMLAAETLATPGADVWSDALDNLLSLGGDLRTGATHTTVPGSDDLSAFATQELRIYVSANVVPDRLLVYADQRFAPGGSFNQEAWGRLSFGEGRLYVKAGQFYLPYGLRLEDDGAFIREVPGVNMVSPDNGVELGYERGPWSLQLAASNGAGGGTETDEGKQASLRAEFVRPGWRLGASGNWNHRQAGDRRMANVFGGLRTGAVAWLAEADWILDDTFTSGERTLYAALLEANWGYARGHNAKLTAEQLEPDADVDEDEQGRYSAVWEWTPIQFLQLRMGARIHEGIPQSGLQNRRHYFAELHAFF
jgi:hypothetical protein